MESKAYLKNCPVPPRKMRILADAIRGKGVEEALNLVKFHPKKGYGRYLEKLLLSGIANWQQKNEDEALEDHSLFVKAISVDEGRTLKRIRPAAMGRANRIRKRANHVSLVIDSHNATAAEESPEEEDQSEDVAETNTQEEE
jgi:large subunit ribosomal protein L22